MRNFKKRLSRKQAALKRPDSGNFPTFQVKLLAKFVEIMKFLLFLPVNYNLKNEWSDLSKVEISPTPSLENPFSEGFLETGNQGSQLENQAEGK